MLEKSPWDFLFSDRVPIGLEHNVSGTSSHKAGGFSGEGQRVVLITTSEKNPAFRKTSLNIKFLSYSCVIIRVLLHFRVFRRILTTRLISTSFSCTLLLWRRTYIDSYPDVLRMIVHNSPMFVSFSLCNSGG